MQNGLDRREQTPNRRGKHLSSGALKFILGLVGLLLFIYLIFRIGPDVILSHIQNLGWNFLLVILLGAMWLFLQSVGWWVIQSTLFRGPGIFTLFRFKIVCDGFNTILPLANLSGEFTRAYLSRKHMPFGKGLAGVMADKTFELLAGLIFMAGGLLAALVFSSVPESLKLPSLIGLGLTAVGLLVLMGLQLGGFYDLLLKITSFLPSINRRLRAGEPKFRNLEKNLLLLYRQPPGRVLLALGFHLAARMLGVVEAWMVLRILGVPIDFFQSLLLMALVAGVNTLFFLMPGQWGIAEGSHLLIVQLLGFLGPEGFSLSIIKRIRKIIFAALGMIIFQIEKARTGTDSHD